MSGVLFTVASAIIVIIVCKLGFVCYKFWEFRRILAKSLPGTTIPAHWLIGNLNQIHDSRSYIDLVRKEADEHNRRLVLLWFGPFPSISVTHPETFKQISKQIPLKARGPMDGYKFFEPWLGEGLLISGGKKWERNRKLLTPAFHFDILNDYVFVMNEVADLLLDKLSEASKDSATVDVMPYVCRATLDAMLRCSLSYEGNVQDETDLGYIKIVKRLSEITWQRSLSLPLLPDIIFNHSAMGREFSKLCGEAHAFTGKIIETRRIELEKQVDSTEHKRHLDFLDILLTARDEHGHGLSTPDIQNEVDTFTFEGHDTTSSAISWTIYALAKYPDLQTKVYEDVREVLGDCHRVTSNHLGKFTYLPLFVKEVLRFFSPVPMIGRRHTDKPVVVDGVEIPVGVSFWVHIYAIHHNKEIWPKHWEFDPERFHASQRDETDVYGFIPFSAGSRNCIGQVFAMNEVKISIAKLVNKFEVIMDTDNEPRLLPDVVMRSENGINVKLERRNT